MSSINALLCMVKKVTKLFWASSSHFHICIAGSVDCSKQFDPNIWLNAMVRESEAPLPFYSISFKVWADNILKRDVNLSQEDITAASCRNVYLHLINEDPR